MIGIKEELANLTAELRARMKVAEDMGPVILYSEKKSSSAPLGAEPAPQPAREMDAADRFRALAEAVSTCRKCPLGGQRLRAVFGVGSPTAQVMFVGEGPGFQEDHQGEPFVGKAGQLLDKILASIGLSRQTVYIANAVKCHAMVDPSNPEAHGNDRPPTLEEIAACRPYLDQQIRLISPRVIVTLGSVATKVFLGEDAAISKVRGHWREYRTWGDAHAVKLLPTYHPAALLRNPNLKRDVWTDMKNLKQELESNA